MNREILDKKIKEISDMLPKGDTLIQILNSSEIVVEGCVGVDEYEDNIICLRLTKQKAVIIGIDLEVETYVSGSVYIAGKIHSVEFDEE